MRDLALDDRERVFYGPRSGDIALLGLLTVILLGNGLYIWHRLGPKNDHSGQAIFWGLALLCALWSILVYTFKLSVCARVGPHGLTITRGPWQTELAWAHVARLVERMQMDGGQRLRWVAALARDGRQLQVREDMVLDYQGFRRETYERYRLWRDHGGTWGTTRGGPYRAVETSSAQAKWFSVLAAFIGLPGLYFWTQIPPAGLLGVALIALALICAGLGLRARLRRQTYSIDAKAIESRRLGGGSRLAWGDVARVDRNRIAFSGLVKLCIHAGRLALRVAARRDGRVQSFDWYPRVPEYLTLRGAGRQVRIRLHRLARPDEMLAWVEFYERLGRRRAETAGPRRVAPVTRRLTPSASVPDLSGPAGPRDPWGAGRQGDKDAPGEEEPPFSAAQPDDATAATAPSQTNVAPDESAAWLRADVSNVWSPGQAPQRHQPAHTWQSDTDTAAGDDGWFQRTPHADDVSATPAATPPEPEFAPGPPAWPHPDAQRNTGFVVPSSTRDPAYGAGIPSQPVDRAPQSTAPHGNGSPEMSWRHSEPLPSPPRHETWPPTSTEPNWPTDDDENASEDGADDAPTAAVESLASAFAPWKDDGSWQRPQFPRYGPPSIPDAEDDR